MIDMTKKYTRKGEGGSLLSSTARKPFCIVWQSNSGDVFLFTETGHGLGPHDLIEVVPDVVTWTNIYPTSHGERCESLQRANARAQQSRIAIQRTTIRNGGKSHTDVTVEVLPCDYVETTP